MRSEALNQSEEETLEQANLRYHHVVAGIFCGWAMICILLRLIFSLGRLPQEICITRD